jgi:hypothetical protein
VSFHERDGILLVPTCPLDGNGSERYIVRIAERPFVESWLTACAFAISPSGKAVAQKSVEI